MGLVTVRDVETGFAASGESKAEALAGLAERPELHAGGGDHVEAEEACLEEIGLDADEIARAREADEGLPEFLRYCFERPSTAS